MPQPVRPASAISSGNLAYPRTIVNDLLQAKIAAGTRGHRAAGGQHHARASGFFDPATRMGLDRHDEDFGQTLGRWGVPPGPT